MTTTLKITNFIFVLLTPFLLWAQPETDVLTVAEQMPYFEGCDHYEPGSEDKRNCSNINLVNFISENIRYPELAKANGIDGTVFLSFVVNEDGSIQSQKVLRDIGGGCAEEALRILNLMPKWEAAIDQGEAVKVRLTLPVTFSIKNSDSAQKSNYQIHWGSLKGTIVTKADLEKNTSSKLYVRDEFGNEVDISNLTFIYERNRSYFEETSSGNINNSLKKVIKKVKRGGSFTILATIFVDGNFIEVDRQFKVSD